MEPEDLFEAWKQQRRRSEVPEGFADRVLDSFREDQRRSQPLRAAGPAEGASFQRLFASWPVQAAVCTLAGLVCLFRMVSFIALFIPG